MDMNTRPYVLLIVASLLAACGGSADPGLGLEGPSDPPAADAAPRMDNAVVQPPTSPDAGSEAAPREAASPLEALAPDAGHPQPDANATDSGSMPPKPDASPVDPPKQDAAPEAAPAPECTLTYMNTTQSCFEASQGRSTCVNGSCERCAPAITPPGATPPYGDCNADSRDGCETVWNDQNCGGCGVACNSLRHCQATTVVLQNRSTIRYECVNN